MAAFAQRLAFIQKFRSHYMSAHTIYLKLIWSTNHKGEIYNGEENVLRVPRPKSTMLLPHWCTHTCRKNLKINKQMLLKFKRNISSCASFSRALTEPVSLFRYVFVSASFCINSEWRGALIASLGNLKCATITIHSFSDFNGLLDIFKNYPFERVQTRSQ